LRTIGDPPSRNRRGELFVWFADKPLKTREQIAREVHAVSLARRLDELATVIALMTISTEVGHNDSNGQRRWWCPWNPADPQTNNFQFDSESDDGLWSGNFEQRSPAPSTGEACGGGLFGSHEGARKRMALADSANIFLKALGDDYTAAAAFEPDSSCRPNALAARTRTAP
jgi:hypothetical protein